MRIIIARIEGNFAIVELPSGQMIDCPRAMLPGYAKEGSILNITVDEEATNDKLQKVIERMNELFRD